MYGNGPQTRSAPPFKTLDEAVEVARTLVPRLRQRVGEAEELRRLPDATMDDLIESRLFDIATPRRWGGAELNTDAVFEVTATLAEGCGSTSWVYALWVMHVWHISQYPEHIQEAILNHPRPLVSSIVNTTGEVKQADGGYIVSARAPYSSGVDHCRWLEVRIQVTLEEGQPPERCWFLIPSEEISVEHDWNTIGLRGTGSHTAIVEEVFVPEERVMKATEVDAGRAGALLHKTPMFCAARDFTLTLPTAGTAVGIANGMVDLFQERCQQRATSAMPLHLQTNGLMRLSEASAEIDAVKALLAEDARHFCYIPAEETTAVERLKVGRDVAYAAQVCREAVQKLFDASGSSSVYTDKEFSRLWRDSNVAAAHFRLTWDVHGLSYGMAFAQPTSSGHLTLTP